jgi:minor extracellular serine protease Vpr
MLQPRKSVRYFLILAGLLIATTLLVNDHLIRRASAELNTTSVIVQFTQDAGAVYKAKTEMTGATVSSDQLQAYRNQLKANQDQFLNDLRARGVAFTIDGIDVPNFAGDIAGHVDFRYTLVLNGIALKVSPSAIATLKGMPQVKSVNATRALRLQLEKSVDYINAPAAYGQVQELTPFDDLREGYEGQGINVAVLDTGIDWTHPMFGGDPTPPRLGIAPPVAGVSTNKKVIYYMTFTGGLIDDFGHGSAASSDIAGYLGIAPGADKLPNTADDVRLHGVAPQARLMGYKVCLGVGSCLTTSTIMAIEDAVSPVTVDLQPKPVAHVINMSLGGPGGPDDDSAVAASNAALLGTVVVASAGNDGPGEGTVASPAAGRHVIAVGADNDPASGSNTADLIGGRTGMIANLLDGSAAIVADITQNYVDCGLAETPADVPDSVAGKIALIARGSTISFGDPVNAGTGLFSNKAANAFAKGAIAAVIYNNEDGELSAATVRASLIPVVGMSKLNGEYLKAQLGAGGVSTSQLRLNKALFFQPQMTDFSSRGPVEGLGQVKPDVTAPGLNIYGATVRVGAPETNTATMFDPTGYIHASGTSFSGPHVSGAVALIKQAHLNFTPAMIRAVLTNTATNLRDAQGVPRGDGNLSEPINAQGGGLINVKAAIDAKAIMGVTGDGINEPAILASHSFGEDPVLNNRVITTRSVVVTIQDTSGQGGSYSLSTTNNRYLDLNGVTATVSPSSVTVPANGKVTLTATVTIDGNKVRDASAPKEVQWYVVARRANSSETLRVPMFWRANPSVPAGGSGSTATETYTGTVLASDGGLQRDILKDYVAADVTYVDVPFVVGPATVGIDASLDFTSVHIADIPSVGTLGVPDLDFILYDPDGLEIARSANGGGPEHLTSSVTKSGTYTYRVYGWLNPPTDFTITSTQLLGGTPPTVQPFAADFIDSQQQRIDFDGNYKLTWLPALGDVLNYEVEESVNGSQFTVVRTTDSNTTSVNFSNAADSVRSYRVRAILPGKIGLFVTIPSNVETLVIDRRCKVNITKTTQSAISAVSFTNGVFQLNLDLTNTSSSNYYPLVELKIVKITSTSGTVNVTNADNGGSGTSSGAAALFGYSNLLGSDDIFSAGEKTSARTIQFRDQAAELFSFDALVTAYQRKGTTASTNTGGASGGSTSSESSGTDLTNLVRITVNPLTKIVTVQLLQ